ncbi:MAG: hypothetical protein ACK4P3_09860, partial [Fimbriimonadaceae bacterium]
CQHDTRLSYQAPPTARFGNFKYVWLAFRGAVDLEIEWMGDAELLVRVPALNEYTEFIMKWKTEQTWRGVTVYVQHALSLRHRA